MGILEKYCMKASSCRKKNDMLDAEDEKNAAETDKKVQAKLKKDAAINEQAEADATGIKTVGADWKDTKSLSAASESIEKNLESQSSSKPASSWRSAGLGFLI